jgi:hypothetical protein
MKDLRSRRRFLAGAAALSAVGAAAAVDQIGTKVALAASPSRDDRGAGPAGTWLETVTGTGFTFQALTTYDVGGGLTGSGSIDLTPPNLSGPTYGTWVLMGDRTFRVEARAFGFDALGHPSGVYFAEATYTLNKSGDTYSGSGSFRLVNNGTVVFSFTYTGLAKRLQVSP